MLVWAKTAVSDHNIYDTCTLMNYLKSYIFLCLILTSLEF